MSENANFALEEMAIDYLRAVRNNKITIRRNKWQPDAQLTGQNIQFDSFLGAGASGSVFKITNTDTKISYALKLQPLQKAEWLAEPPETHQPPLSASSQAYITSPTEAEREQLSAKRHEETKTYLRYIKKGHPNVTQLVAFNQYHDTPIDPDDPLMRMGQFFELADCGVVANLQTGAEKKSTKVPELFLWKMLLQLMDGLAFLHNEHPDYNSDPENSHISSILCPDMSGGNVFLKWPEGKTRENSYPDIKIGDFGSPFFVPIGGGFMDPDQAIPRDEPPELEWRSAKMDVWFAGSMVYELARRHGNTSPVELPSNFNDLPWEAKYKALKDPRRVKPIDSYLSESFQRMLNRALVLDYKERPTAYQLFRELEGPATRRLASKIMWRALPTWVGREGIPRFQFSQERLRALDEGLLEVELEQRRLKMEEQDTLEEEADAAVNAWEEWKEARRAEGTWEDLDTDDDTDYFEASYEPAREAGLAAGTWVDPGPDFR